ncbi:MAG: hypothetical protein JRI85_14340 [Deltaproteobacteria bacterium]|nr:hypothetical protein [Deltaproteobacteria bacterium]
MPSKRLIRALVLALSLFFILACGEKPEREASSSAEPNVQPQGIIKHHQRTCL